MELCVLSSQGTALRLGSFILTGSMATMQSVVGHYLEKLDESPLLFLDLEVLDTDLRKGNASSNCPIFTNFLTEECMKVLIEGMVSDSIVEYYLRLCCELHEDLSLKDSRSGLMLRNGSQRYLNYKVEEGLPVTCDEIRLKLMEFRSCVSSKDDAHQALVKTWESALISSEVNNIRECAPLIKQIQRRLEDLALGEDMVPDQGDYDQTSQLRMDSRLMLDIKECLESKEQYSKKHVGCLGPWSVSSTEPNSALRSKIFSSPGDLLSVLALAKIFQNSAICNICTSVLQETANDFVAVASMDDWKDSDLAMKAANMFYAVGSGIGLSGEKLAKAAFYCHKLSNQERYTDTYTAEECSRKKHSSQIPGNTLGEEVEVTEDDYDGHDFMTDSDHSDSESHTNNAEIERSYTWNEGKYLIAPHDMIPGGGSRQVEVPQSQESLPQLSTSGREIALGDDNGRNTQSDTLDTTHLDHTDCISSENDDLSSEAGMMMARQRAPSPTPRASTSTRRIEMDCIAPPTVSAANTEESITRAQRRAQMRSTAYRRRHEMDKALASAQDVLRRDRLKSVNLRASVIRASATKLRMPSSTRRGKMLEFDTVACPSFGRSSIDLETADPNIEAARRRAAIRVKQRNMQMRRKEQLGKAMERFEKQKKWVKRNDNIARFMMRSRDVVSEDEHAVESTFSSSTTDENVHLTMPKMEALEAVGLDPAAFMEISRIAHESPQSPFEVGPTIGEDDSVGILEWSPACGYEPSTSKEVICRDDCSEHSDSVSAVSSLGDPSGLMDMSANFSQNSIQKPSKVKQQQSPKIVIHVGRVWGLPETVGGEGTYAVISFGKHGTLSTKVLGNTGSGITFNADLQFEVGFSLDNEQKIAVLLYKRHNAMSDQPVACCEIMLERLRCAEGKPVVVPLSSVGVDGKLVDDGDAEAGFIQVGAEITS